MDDYAYQLRRKKKGRHCLCCCNTPDGEHISFKCGCGSRTPPSKHHKKKIIRSALKEELKLRLVEEL